MVTEPFVRLYLDSSVFFALVKQEQTTGLGGLTRWEIARHIFEDAESGKYALFTYTVTIAEVRRVRERTEPLDWEEIRQVQRFLQRSFIQTIDVTRPIAEMAQELGAEHGMSPIDTIHLATAIWNGCDVLFVWDKRFSRRFEDGPIGGVTVTEPYWSSAGF